MFYVLVVFVLSLIFEILIFFMLDPDNPDGSINAISAVSMALNSGLLLGSLFVMVLFVFFALLKEADPIRSRRHVYAGVGFGVLVSGLVGMKLFGVLDGFLTGIMVASFVLFQMLVFARKYR